MSLIEKILGWLDNINPYISALVRMVFAFSVVLAVFVPKITIIFVIGILIIAYLEIVNNTKKRQK